MSASTAVSISSVAKGKSLPAPLAVLAAIALLAGVALLVGLSIAAIVEAEPVVPAESIALALVVAASALLVSYAWMPIDRHVSKKRYAGRRLRCSPVRELSRSMLDVDRESNCRRQYLPW